MGYIFINILSLIFLDEYNVLWGVYLYIGLLTQPSYLTYVGFLNIPPQTQDVILMKPLSLFTKE